MLLAYGADITARTNGGTSALAMIVRKIPNVLPKFEDMLGEFPIGRENSTHTKDYRTLRINPKINVINKGRCGFVS